MSQVAARGAVTQLLHQWEVERPDLDLTAFRVVAATMQLAQVMESAFRQFGQERFGMGSGDLRILLALRRAGPPYALRPTDLFSALLVSSGAVTKQVDRLVEAGFVERVVPEGNVKRSVIALTAAGVAAADAALDEITHSLAGIGSSLAAMRPADVGTMLRGLDLLLAGAMSPPRDGAVAAPSRASKPSTSTAPPAKGRRRER